MARISSNLNLTGRPPLGENIRYQLVGFTVVMTVLAALWLLVRLVGLAFRHVPTEKLAEAQPPGPSPTPPPATPPGLKPEILAVISAAIHTMLHGPHRIVSISESPRVPRDTAQVTVWSVEGRRQIFSSHTLR